MCPGCVRNGYGWSALSTRGAGQRWLRLRDKEGPCRPDDVVGWARAWGARHPAGYHAPVRSGRWLLGLSIRPVLKHGPRSLTCVRVGGFKTRLGERKLMRGSPLGGAPCADHDLL